MKFLGVIPARFGSSRLEGKPLKDICGHTMIEWVYKRAKRSNLDDVIVATDDERIYEEVLNFGGKAILTRKDHENGTSRIAEVCQKMDGMDVIINIQGDEPLIEREMINSLINCFRNEPELKMATLKHRLATIDEIENPNNVKVITDKNDYALYFSRSVIPYPRKENMNNYFKHIGIYGYQKDFVIEYSKLPQTKLEISESLEQLRVLENGYKIKVLETNCQIVGVDTQLDLEKVKEIIKNKKISIDEE
ncbi:3-deoxy-manno-octulosonate cytidylyltransferase [Fusobacterium sp. MFO224]|uniref:3-deoxy-manno-octulosonate cytidylyltransferase n=1 Tax=Fusobacterium sp. MFO224 TaxID=3378070 RepID=UPI0038526BC8